MQKALILLSRLPNNWQIHDYYIKIINNLYIDCGIELLNFMKLNEKWIDIINTMNDNYNEKWLYFFWYNNIEEIKEIISNYEIIETTTFDEWLIDIVIEIKKHLWDKNIENNKIFRSKFLQRQKLLEYDESITVKYKYTESIEKIDINEIEREIWYPFIMKPVKWIQSQFVYKVNDRKNFQETLDSFKKWNKEHLNKLNESNNIEILFEEFVDWVMYSIDYYVSQIWTILYSKPVKVIFWKDLWVDDFFNFVRLSWKSIDNELSWVDINWFINKCVEATWIRWTFVHHEFKLNSKWELKTIEMNWRIWWYRLEMMREWYNFNLFKFILWEKMQNINSDNNVWIFVIYSTKRWILKGFNEKLIGEIENMKSLFKINKIRENIWKETWLTKDWFTKNLVVKLINNNFNQFETDVQFMMRNRDNLLTVE